jgi:hypothetical protein
LNDLAPSKSASKKLDLEGNREPKYNRQKENKTVILNGLDTIQEIDDVHVQNFDYYLTNFSYKNAQFEKNVFIPNPFSRLHIKTEESEN